jgi:GxxExxY protein
MSLITTPEATRVIGCALRVHTELGPGLFESVYEDCLTHELRKAGLAFRRQVGLAVTYDGRTFPRAFVADLIVEDALLVEIKSVETVLAVHAVQVQTYLKLSGLQKGLMINFNVASLRDGIRSFLSTPRRSEPK